MPTRGYRKGISDRKEPAPRSLRAHITERMFARHQTEADARGRTRSRLLFDILKAHQARTRLEAPHTRHINAAALRELARIGNNLNQIAHQANVMNLHLIEAEARRALDAVLDAVRRL